jgi:bacteriocin biosynthesis cyclodehydratase domain-containing protein
MTERPTTRTAIPEKPALAPWFRILPGEDRLLLEHGGTVVAYDGKAAGVLLPSLLPLLDGTRDVETIVDVLGQAIAPATLNALELLNERGALLEGPQPSAAEGPVCEAAVFTGALGHATPAVAHARLSGSRVAVWGSGPVSSEVARTLQGTGLRIRQTGEGDVPTEAAELLVAAPAPREVAELERINDVRLEREAPWLQVLPNDGHVVAIGPLFVPGTSGCHTCYRLRRGACSGFEDDFDLIASASSNAGSPLPATAVAAGIAGLLALRWLATGDPTIPGRFYALETGVVVGVSYHRLLRVPRCPTCGAGNTPVPSPWFDEKAHADPTR